MVTITRNGDKLLAQATGLPPVELLPESETCFFVKALDAELTFTQGSAGAVAGLMLDLSGLVLNATREGSRLQ